MARMNALTRPSAGMSVKARLIALAMIVVGAGAGWHSGIGPLRLAQAGTPVVHYDPKFFLPASMLLVCGVLQLIGGAPVFRALSSPPRGRQQHLVVWSVCALSAAAAGLAWWWLEAQFKALGYHH